MSGESRLDISIQSILKIFIAVFVLYILFLVKTIVFWFFFALAISILLEPAINVFRKFRVPKIIAVFFVYLSIFGILAFLIYLSAPIFIYELRQFAQNLPEYFVQINPILRQLGINIAGSFNDLVSAMVANFEENSKSLLAGLATVFGGLSAAFSILTIALFLSLEEKGPERFLSLIAPKRYEEQVVSLFERVQKKVAGWFGARVLACIFVGIASFIAFYIFSLKYAFVLAVLAGFLNFVPFIGPFITLILIAVMTGVTTGSWFTVFYVSVTFLIIQAIENSVLTPMLMKRLINIPPVVVLIALFAGTKLFGVLGAIFFVPAFGIVYESIKEFLERRKEENSTDYA